jgi:hypothetical protein
MDNYNNLRNDLEEFIAFKKEKERKLLEERYMNEMAKAEELWDRKEFYRKEREQDLGF